MFLKKTNFLFTTFNSLKEKNYDMFVWINQFLHRFLLFQNFPKNFWSFPVLRRHIHFLLELVILTFIHYLSLILFEFRENNFFFKTNQHVWKYLKGKTDQINSIHSPFKIKTKVLPFTFSFTFFLFRFQFSFRVEFWPPWRALRF